MAVGGVCPSCGAKFPLEAALQDARARQALAGALKIDARLADPLLTYLGLFSTADGRAVRMDKLVRVISEVAEPIAAAKLEHNRRVWPAPIEYWREALEATLAQRDKLKLPLNGHGYLFSIVASIAARADGNKERRAETAKQNRAHTGKPAAAVGEIIDRQTKSADGRKMLKDAVKGGA
ncbi:MAG: hypothetical protein OEW08_11400 [Gammaproteobacteria bacterium]|nr:hypothetical protein [Gammaproteobacteria bacterium]